MFMTALGIGLSPPGYDVVAHQAALVDAESGEVLWFNSAFEQSRSLLFPDSRYGTVQRLLKSLPSSGKINTASQQTSR